MSRYIGMAQLVSPPSTCQKIFSLLGMLRNKTQVVVNMQRVEWLFRLSWFFLEQLCFQLHCWYRSSAAEKIAGGMNQGRGTKLCWWSVMDFSLRICGLKKKPRCHLRMSWMKHWKLGGGFVKSQSSSKDLWYSQVMKCRVSMEHCCSFSPTVWGKCSCVGADPAERIFFLLEITIDGQTILIHTSVFSGHLPEVEQSEPVIIASDKIQVFKQKLEFWKTWICRTFF